MTQPACVGNFGTEPHYATPQCCDLRLRFSLALLNFMDLHWNPAVSPFGIGRASYLARVFLRVLIRDQPKDRRNPIQ